MVQQNPNKNKGIIIGVVTVLVVVFATAFLGRKSADTSATATPSPVADQGTPAPTVTDAPATPVTPTTPATPPVATVPPVDTPKKVTSVYKDGTYTATGSYMSPGGQDQLGVTLTIANDIVTDATVVNGANDGTSSRYQNRFISGYKTYVIGKNIGSINLTRVSGASLTPEGFNDALTQIKAKAKA